MSDHDKNDQQKFESLLSPEGDQSRSMAFDMEEPVVTQKAEHDDLASMADIDDGIDDPIDEAGIFAASMEGRPVRKKSSSSATALFLVLVALGGGAGYYYYTHPDLMKQVTANLSGDASVKDLLSDVGVLGDGAASVTTSAPDAPQDQPVESATTAGEATPAAADGDMPPQPEPILVDSAGVEAPVGAVPDMPAEQDVAAIVPVSEGDAATKMITPESTDTKTAKDEKEVNVTAPEKAPVPADVPAEIVAEPAPMEKAPAAEPTTNAVVADIAAKPAAQPDTQAAQGNAKIIRPVEKNQSSKLMIVDDTATAKKPDDASLASVSGEAASQKPAEQGKDTTTEAAAAAADLGAPADAADEKKEAVYFDSPPGKALASIPAPSLDAKRGKGESIIVVNASGKGDAKADKPKKSSTRKKHSDSDKVTIEATSLDDKVIGAGRALKLGRYDAAREMYDELYALNPRDPRVLMGRAVLYQKLGETGRAISTYEELLAVTPDNAEAVVNLAGLVRKERPAIALSELLDLRQKYPDNPAVAAQLGVAYADSGNLEDAFRYLQMAADLQPENPQHYFNMAVISERTGDSRRAIEYYERALDADAIHGDGGAISRNVIYDRLTRLRGH